MGKIEYEFINIEEDDNLKAIVDKCLNNIFEDLDYSNKLKKVVFTENIESENALKHFIQGEYNPQDKTITVKVIDKDNILLTVYHELLHVKFEIVNENLFFDLSPDNALAYQFINEFFAYRDSQRYIMAKKDLDLNKKLMDGIINNLEVYTEVMNIIDKGIIKCTDLYKKVKENPNNYNECSLGEVYNLIVKFKTNKVQYLVKTYVDNIIQHELIEQSNSMLGTELEDIDWKEDINIYLNNLKTYKITNDECEIVCYILGIGRERIK